jgi:hypothetical protein
MFRRLSKEHPEDETFPAADRRGQKAGSSLPMQRIGDKLQVLLDQAGRRSSLDFSRVFDISTGSRC